MSKKLRCFLKKFTQLTKILHDRRSRRSRQIPSLDAYSKLVEVVTVDDVDDENRVGNSLLQIVESLTLCYWIL